jgi:epoxyqueuosine reductase QueG
MLEQLKERASRLASTWGRERIQGTIWRSPLMAVASADDPLFSRLCAAVAPDHAMPTDLLPGVRSVLAFFIPFTQELGQQNDREPEFASRSWAEAYVLTNRLIHAVNEELSAAIRERGFEVAATPATHNFDERRLVSGWSHKHVGFIAGLGTFGSHHWLITEAGCCGRLGSLLTTMDLPPTPRPEVEYCLLKAGKRCGGCFKKCRYDALLPDHFDRHACYRQCLVNDAHYSDLPLVDVCGKCGCEVPCSYGIPPASIP